MSWRNTDRAFGSRARGLRGMDGLEGFVPPGSTPVARWRNTDRAYGNRPRGLGATITGYDDEGNPIYDTSGSTTTIDTSGGYFGTPPFWTPTPVASSGGGSGGPDLATTIAKDAQIAFSDAFSVLKLFNPVPPGTVQVTNPQTGYSYTARAGSSGGVPSTGFNIPGLTSGGSSMGILLVVGLGALILFARKD